MCAGESSVRQAPTILELKARQSAKIREIRDALVAAGCDRLDVQAGMLGISRSTTCSVLRGTHKASGLSASVIVRMLKAPRLEPAVRAKILEYVSEKRSGKYGGTKRRLRVFVKKLREHDCCRMAIEGLSDSGDLPAPAGGSFSQHIRAAVLSMPKTRSIDA